MPYQAHGLIPYIPTGGFHTSLREDSIHPCGRMPYIPAGGFHSSLREDSIHPCGRIPFIPAGGFHTSLRDDSIPSNDGFHTLASEQLHSRLRRDCYPSTRSVAYHHGFAVYIIRRSRYIINSQRELHIINAKRCISSRHRRAYYHRNVLHKRR